MNSNRNKDPISRQCNYSFGIPDTPQIIYISMASSIEFQFFKETTAQINFSHNNAKLEY